MLGSTPGTIQISYAGLLLIISIIISLTNKKMFEIDDPEKEE